ncbi:S24 family peptidase [Thiorhodovibrio litoralis]|uniref:S24 family peptidase n=2 Tax=Thiorhodovibrio TaxID=61593 RepID=UPI00191346C1|nr:S24 family peptidase [Thiorhodovibrio litoralis]
MSDMDMGMDNGGCALQEPFALQVLGPDMEPEFPDRCVVVIEPVNRAEDGMYVFVEVEGVRWLRQYKRDPQGQQWLVALDPNFPAIALDGLQWQVLGVVIQRNIRRKVKHYEYDQGNHDKDAAPELGGDPAPSPASPLITDLTGT